MDQLGQSMQNPMPHDPNNRPAEFLGYSKGEYRLIWSRARQLIQFSLKPRCTERESHEVLAQTAQEPGSQVIANRRWYIGSRRAVRGARDIIRGRGRRGVLSSQRILSGYDMHIAGSCGTRSGMITVICQKSSYPETSGLGQTHAGG